MCGGGGVVGPRANFKISLRDLPDHARFRVTVRAARDDDGLLLASKTGIPAEPTREAIVIENLAKPQTGTIAKAGS